MSPLPGLFLVALALAGTVEVSDRSEIRVRDSNEPVGTVVDLETAPDARVRVRARGFEITLGYSPRFTFRQINVVVAPQILHHGALDIAARFRRAEIRIHGDVAYGTESFTSLVPEVSASQVSPPLQRLPPASTIAYTSSRAGVTARYAATRRWTVGGLFEHALSGGVDARARAVVPFQSGPRGALSADYALTRKDRVTALLDAARAMFSSGTEDTVLAATLAWRHALSRSTESMLSAGAAESAYRPEGGEPVRFHTYPVAEAVLAHRIPEDRLETRFSLRLAPVIDRLSGQVDQRVEGAAAVTWALTPAVAVRGRISAAESVPWTRDGALAVFLGEAAVSARASERVRFEVGTRGAWQAQRGASAPSPAQWIAFAGATFMISPLRF